MSDTDPRTTVRLLTHDGDVVGVEVNGTRLHGVTSVSVDKSDPMERPRVHLTLVCALLPAAESTPLTDALHDANARDVDALAERLAPRIDAILARRATR